MALEANPECIPFALTQVLATARLVTDDHWIHRKVLMRAVADLAEEPDLERSAPEIIYSSLSTAYKALGVKDPYEEPKRRINQAAQALEPHYQREIEESEDRLATALELAFAGSVIGRTEEQREIREAVTAARTAPFPRDDRAGLLRAFRRAESVFYVLNNAGEVIFDKLLVTELARTRKVIVVARHSPVLDDVTHTDAETLGFDAIENVQLTDPGFPMLGIWLENSEQALREQFEEADVVLCKGQANYESLCGTERDAFFLLRAKSLALAEHLQVDPGSLVACHHTAPVPEIGEETEAPATP
ncbi:MAG: damage-control phosphatase ARMT1 family protein [Planctomycetota bacterium]|jgi:uncharacterized protein with ATP-grasp and redox domains